MLIFVASKAIAASAIAPFWLGVICFTSIRTLVRIPDGKSAPREELRHVEVR